MESCSWCSRSGAAVSSHGAGTWRGAAGPPAPAQTVVRDQKGRSVGGFSRGLSPLMHQITEWLSGEEAPGGHLVQPQLKQGHPEHCWKLLPRGL